MLNQLFALAIRSGANTVHMLYLIIHQQLSISQSISIRDTQRRSLLGISIPLW